MNLWKDIKTSFNNVYYLNSSQEEINEYKVKDFDTNFFMNHNVLL